MSELPNRIREVRKSRGLTLQEVADKVHCSAIQLSDLERGQRRLSVDWMKRVAAALDVQPGDLLLASDNSLALTPDEQDLVRRFRAAGDVAQGQIMALLDVLAPSDKQAA